MCQHIYCSYNNICVKKFISLGAQMELKFPYIFCTNLHISALKGYDTVPFLFILIEVNDKYCLLIKGSNLEGYLLTVNLVQSCHFTTNEDFLCGILYLQSNCNYVKDVCKETQNYVKPKTTWNPKPCEALVVLCFIRNAKHKWGSSRGLLRFMNLRLPLN